ncbi:MAG: nucleoside triphosphate pyrophosphatase [Acidimicrobiia bacterium]|nr:septum formation inhibitor Maf [Thermoanaerobacterales bacterium]
MRVVARTLVLASRSPARRALLQAAGFAPRVVVSGVDEDGVAGLDAATATCVLAERKATAVADRLAAGGAPADGPPPVVVACDSVLDVDGELRGRPAGPEEAARWWRGYRGRTGTLVTGHAVIDVPTARRAVAASATVVRFGDPTDEEIEAYVATGEPLDVAGGFTLDGYAAPFVDGVDGDHGTVLGLSLPLLRRLLAEVGIDVTTLWAPR